MASRESKDRTIGVEKKDEAGKTQESAQPQEPPKPRWTEEERLIIKEHVKRASLWNASAILLLSIWAYLVLNDRVTFAGVTRAQDLADFPSRLKFLFRFQTLNLFWIFFSFVLVTLKRGTTPAIVPNQGYDHLVQDAQNHLRNTNEQFLLSFLSQLVLITYLDAASIIRFIPSINILFFIGRFTFWLGYPRHRSFGFFINFWVLLITVGYNLWKFFQFYRLI